MLARQEIRKEIAILSMETSPPPVAGHRLDNININHRTMRTERPDLMKHSTLKKYIAYIANKKRI